MRVIPGGNLSWAFHKKEKYGFPIDATGKIHIAQDTRFIGTNFSQKAPHTPLFDVAPGALVIFEECNLVNATVPDGAVVIGGNLAHVVPAETGNPDRPTLNLLCECEKCACARAELAERIESRTLPKDGKGRVLHHALKETYRARRLSPKKAADLAAHVADNEAALARWTPDEQETLGWFARVWSAAKALVGIQ